jgi:glycosyltransferase involved in cell wall biosynthesis
MKKRILIDCHKFDDKFEGIRTFIKGVYLAFGEINKDYDIYLAAFDIKNLQEEFKDLNGAHFIKLRFKNNIMRLIFEIPYLIYKHKISFAHFQYVVPPIKFCKYIVTCHDILFNDYPQYFTLYYRYIKNFMYKYSIRKSEIVTTVSNYSKDRIAEVFSVHKDRIIITPNAVGAEFKKEINKEKSKEYINGKYNIQNYLIYVSRIEPRKNHQNLLKAFVELNLWKSKYSLVFIGKICFKNEELQNIYESLDPDVKSHIYFLEDIPQFDLIHFYNASILSVFPSLAEGFGIPPLESVTMGVPTLCSNQTAMRDFDFFGEYLFNPLDLNELKIKINKQLQEGNQNIKLIAYKVHQKYSWGNTSRVLYKAIINENSNNWN